MPRRGFVPKREVLPDPVYGNTIVTKLINQIMLDGKRGIAQSVCYDAFQMLADKTGKDAMEVFNVGLQNILPSLEANDLHLFAVLEALSNDVAHRAQGSLGILAGQTRLRGDRRAQFVLIHGTKNPP